MQLSPRNERGFTIVELAIVVIIIMVLSSLGVPRLRDSMERGRVEDAFSYLTAVTDAQRVFKQTHGVYAGSQKELAELPTRPAGFVVGEFRPGTGGDPTESWTIHLERTGAPQAYGGYSIGFSEQGYQPDLGSLDQHETLAP